jgi:hypothetical protein
MTKTIARDRPFGVPSEAISVGRRWVVEDADLVSSYRYLREGSLGFIESLRGYAGVREAAWFAHDDPRPAWNVFGRSLGRVVRATLRRSRRKAAAPARSRSRPGGSVPSSRSA